MTIFCASHQFSRTLGDVWWQSLKTAITSAQLFAVFDDNLLNRHRFSRTLGERKSKGSVGHACETGKPQQDSSPNLPKPSPVKLSNVAFWRPKETERWCNHKQRKPQQCNHKQRNPSIATTSETKKPQQDSSPRGGQFVPWRAAETASSKPLKANQNHGKPGRI